MASTERDICNGRFEHVTYSLQIERYVTDGLNMAPTDREICNGQFEHGTYR